MLFDPFEEQLYLPPVAVKPGDGQCWQCEVVGQKNEGLVGFDIVVFDAPELLRVILVRIKSGQHYGLIAPEAGAFVYRARVQPTELQVGFGSCDEECQTLAHRVQSGEVHIAPIHNVERARFRNQNIEHIDVVQLAIADVNKCGNIAA